MNIKKLVSSPVFLSMVAMISSACWCGPTKWVDELPKAPATEATEAPQEPQAKMICPMEWTSPTNSSDAGEMPATGMVSFDWTDHPTAGGYEMTVITPNNSPVEYETNSSAKDLFLENYSQVGSYQVVVTAIDLNGNTMCSITMNFSMPVVSGNGNPNNNNNDSEDEPVSGGGDQPVSIIPSNPIIPPSNPVIIPSNPIIPPAPTEDPPK